MKGSFGTLFQPKEYLPHSVADVTTSQKTIKEKLTQNEKAALISSPQKAQNASLCENATATPIIISPIIKPSICVGSRRIHGFKKKTLINRGALNNFPAKSRKMTNKRK